MKLNDHIYFYPESGMLDCNTYLIKDEKTMIIDVGLSNNLPILIKAIEKDGVNPYEVDIITNSHLHLDHTWANQEFKETYGGQIHITPVQKESYHISVYQTSRFFGIEPVEFKEDGLLNSPVNLGSLKIEIIPTPGHSPESLCFYCPQTKALICGDLLFDRNTGRSDLPGGNREQLKKSIEKVAELDIDFLLPGHMGILIKQKKIKENFEFLKNYVFRWL